MHHHTLNNLSTVMLLISFMVLQCYSVFAPFFCVLVKAEVKLNGCVAVASSARAGVDEKAIIKPMRTWTSHHRLSAMCPVLGKLSPHLVLDTHNPTRTAPCETQQISNILINRGSLSMNS